MSSATPSEEASVVEAIRTGDEHAFADLAARYRRQLHLHCYRMVGSFEDAEDLVQDTFLRAWRGRATFQGRSLFRTWLYRIATNACLNMLERAPRRVVPSDVVSPVTASTDASEARAEPPLRPELPWLQPYPDVLIDQTASSDVDPEAAAISRETIQLAYLVAVQHLPPRQRAVLLLRDALGWSANEVAGLLELSVAAVNSALQRARSTMRSQLPPGRDDWAHSEPRTETERSVLQSFMDAWERADATALTSLLREDARWAMPPAALWFEGRASIARLFALFPIEGNGQFRMLPTAANRQPAAASYLRREGDVMFRLTGVHVLRVDNGAIAEVTSFGEPLCHGFGLPSALDR